MRLLRFLQRQKKPKFFLVRQIMGDSMAPTLKPGALIFGIRPRKVRPGDVVVIHHDNLDKVKRVKHIEFDKVFLTGDNYSHSTDSRDFGWLDMNSVIAKVIWPRQFRS